MIKMKHVRITSRVRYEVLLLAEYVGGKDLGRCDPNKKQMLISMKHGKREAERTFIHEVLHAIEFEYDLRIPHALIRILEIPIWKILKLNGWI